MKLVGLGLGALDTLFNLYNNHIRNCQVETILTIYKGTSAI